jgi:PLD-like domain
MHRAYIALASLGLGVLLVTACSAGPADDSASEDADLVAGDVTTAIEKTLGTTNPSGHGRIWQTTTGNSLPDGWLMQVPVESTWGARSVPPPPRCQLASHCLKDFALRTCASDSDCGGSPCVALEATKTGDADPAQVCAGHSDAAILDPIYEVMTSAERAVDVTSLGPPTGKFLATMRNALTVLDKKDKPIVARFLFGSYFGHQPDLNALLADLTRDVHGAKLEVSVGTYSNGPTTWNHSKIIAADGVEAILGGMNLWDEHYLEGDPVHDVSAHVHGPAATMAHRFANELWASACGTGAFQGLRGNACPAMFADQLSPATGGIRMMTVGRLGQAFMNPSDDALVTMMDAARKTIRIAQQDIGSVKILLGGVLPYSYMDAWTRAAKRGVDVTIVVSNDNSYGGPGRTQDDAYFNGWALSDLWQGLAQRAAQTYPGSQAALCKHVHFEHVRSSDGETWPSGMPLAQHGKVVIVDDAAFYLGSQNLYQADLAEIGVIVDDPPTTAAFVSDYYGKLAQYSKRTAYVDPSCR